MIRERECIRDIVALRKVENGVASRRIACVVQWTRAT